MKTPIGKLVSAVLLSLMVQPAFALVIDLKSGNGSLGGSDSDISMLLGPANTGFSSVFTPADFSAARSGPAAEIISNHTAWIPPASFAGDTTAQWISTSQSGASEGGTALYAIDFDVSLASIGTATLDFYWSVDNQLGFGPNPDGIFLNGLAVPGISGGTFKSSFSSLGLDVASMLQPGENTLFLNSVDVGGPSGLLFSASLDVAPGTVSASATSVPEPSALLLLGLGLVLMGRFVGGRLPV